MTCPHSLNNEITVFFAKYIVFSFCIAVMYNQVKRVGFDSFWEPKVPHRFENHVDRAVLIHSKHKEDFLVNLRCMIIYNYEYFPYLVCFHVKCTYSNSSCISLKKFSKIMLIILGQFFSRDYYVLDPKGDSNQ